MKKTKLTDQELDTLIWMYTACGATKERLARDYDLKPSDVTAILRGKKRAGE
jgi:DNA-binding MarR family transcriptional regulator